MRWPPPPRICGRRAGDGKFAEFRDYERRGLHEARELYPDETLKNHMRSAILPRDARADEAEPGDVMEIIRRHPFTTTLAQHGHAKHALIFQSPREHFPIALFKDEKRHERVGEERRLRQHHDRSDGGDFDACCFWCVHDRSGFSY